MTNVFIDKFNAGLDVRRNILTGEPGSLQVLDNCVITQGGEIEKRLAFVKVFTFPSSSWVGLNGWDSGSRGSGQLYAWELGSGTTALGTLHPTTGDIPIIGKGVAPVSGGSNLVVQDVEEYGTGMHFVAGTVDVGGTPVFHNWWLGVDVPGLVGNSPETIGQKMYRLAGSLLNFSGVGDPSATNPLDPAGDGPNIVNPGAGFIDCSRLSSNTNNLVGMGPFYKQVAVFSQQACLIFSLDPDLANNSFQQYLASGCLSNGSIQQFGTGDLLYLSQNGVRSLRALNASLAAGVSDLGSPIDKLIMQAILDFPTAGAPPSFPNAAHAIIEPLTGRYWLAIGNKIYVLSFWPSAKISAWSTFSLPFNVDNMCVTGTKVFIRSGLDVYIYGGLDGATYDNSLATVVTPFDPADTPTTEKLLESVGAMVTGTWALSIGMKTDMPTFYELVANLIGDTYSLQKYGAVGSGTHIGFKLTSTFAGPATIGALTAKFHKGREV